MKTILGDFKDYLPMPPIFPEIDPNHPNSSCPHCGDNKNIKLTDVDGGHQVICAKCGSGFGRTREEAWYSWCRRTTVKMKEIESTNPNIIK